MPDNRRPLRKDILRKSGRFPTGNCQALGESWWSIRSALVHWRETLRFHPRYPLAQFDRKQAKKIRKEEV